MKAEGGAKHLAERKGKTEVMAISHSSVGWLSRAGTGKLLARLRAQFIKDPCAFLLHEPASRTIKKHGGQGSYLGEGGGA